MISSSSHCRSLGLHRHFLSQITFLRHFHYHGPYNQSFSAKPPKPKSEINPHFPKQVKESNFITTHTQFHERTEKPTSPDFDQNTVLETLSCYRNDWKRARDFFNWIEAECGFQHTTRTYNRMIGIFGKFFEFDLAWDLVSEMKEDVSSMPDYTTFRILFNRYASAHLVEEAIRTYHKTEEFNLKDGVSFSNLIDSLCEYKHVVEAEEMCLGKNSEEGMQLFVNTKIYNIILRGWFKMGWWSKCREFWEEMDKRGVHKDLHSYSIYMNIQSKSGKPWRAVKLYKEMKRKGIRLDVVAYNTVIQATGRLEGVDFSIRLFSEMVELGCEPSVVTYNIIIKLLCEKGRVNEACKLFEQMRAKGCAPDVITYNSIFGYLEKPREILQLFDQMMSSGVRPRMDTYVLLMRKFGRWGFLRLVFIVWKRMEEHGLSPDEHAYNAMIDALLEKGMVDMARKYDEEMLAKGLPSKPRVELGTKILREESESSYSNVV